MTKKKNKDRPLNKPHREDSSATEPLAEKQVTLPEADMARYVQLCYHGSIGHVRQMKLVLEEVLTSLGKNRPRGKAAPMPGGDTPTNIDLQSAYAQFRKIGKDDKAAVAQLETLLATTKVRNP